MEKQEIISLIDSLGLSYSAQFVPFSQSRNKGEKNFSLNWKVTIAKGTHSSQQLTTDYMQGIGHLPGYSHNASNKMLEHANVEYAAESGKWDARHDKAGFRTTPQFQWKAIKPPELIDVLHSLVMDSDVINYSSFEDWADCFGYDADSRQAEKIYNDCLQIALKLRAMLGDSTMHELQEAFRDY